MALVLVFLGVGMVATNIFGRKLVTWWEYLLTRVPVVKTVYLVIKSVVDTISIQNKEQFNRVVLIEFPRKGQYSIAFVTGITKALHVLGVIGAVVWTEQRPGNIQAHSYTFADSGSASSAAIACLKFG